LPYAPALDGMRGLAVALVVLAHAAPNFVVGRVGVDVFFVLSGYLITTILLVEWRSRGRIDLRAFYVRRFLRLFPPLAVVLVAYIAAAPLWLTHGMSAAQLLVVVGAAVTYTWNVLIVGLGALPSGVPGALSHLWSLAQEEQFYLVFPLILVVALRRRAGARLLMWSLLGLGLAMLTLYAVTAGSLFAEFSPLTRGCGLLAGCVLAVGRWGWQGFRVAAVAAWSAVLGLAMVMAGVALHWWPMDVDIPAALLASFVVTAHVTSGSDSTMTRLLGGSWLVRLGLMSYSLYLWHLPLLVLARDVGGLGRLVGAAVAVPIALVLAELTRRYVELPMAKLKERWVRVQPPRQIPIPAPPLQEQSGDAGPLRPAGS